MTQSAALYEDLPIRDNLAFFGRLFGLSKHVEVEGWCSEYFLDVEHPAVGCGHCHEHRGGPSIFDLLNEPED